MDNKFKGFLLAFLIQIANVKLEQNFTSFPTETMEGKGRKYNIIYVYNSNCLIRENISLPNQIG